MKEGLGKPQPSETTGEERNLPLGRVGVSPVCVPFTELTVLAMYENLSTTRIALDRLDCRYTFEARCAPSDSVPHPSGRLTT
jgi:hypothetical protein